MTVLVRTSSDTRHATTQTLVVDPRTLPPAEPPSPTAAAAYLAAATPPDLSRRACPHLYYDSASAAADPPSSSSSSSALQRAAALLGGGQAVAIPTETVYGLAASALSGAAVGRVFAAKGRPPDNPLIVHVSDLDMLARLYPPAAGHDGSSTNSTNSTDSSSSVIPACYHRLVAAFWPGPLTLLLPASPLVAPAVTAGLATMAVRMPAHPVARALIAAAGVPLAAPSANTSGRPSPTSAQHVLQDLAGAIAAVVDGGPCACGVESTVLDGLRQPPVVLRPGGVTAEQLAACPDMAGLQVYQRDFTDAQLEAQPSTPGMKYRHYSPTAPLLLVDPTPAWQQQQQQQQTHTDLPQLVVAATNKLLQEVTAEQQADASRRCVVLLRTCDGSSSSNSSDVQVGWTAESLRLLHSQHPQQHGTDHQLQQPQPGHAAGAAVLEFVLGSWQQPETVAQQVFGALRAADALQPHAIVVQGLPPEGAGLAVMNRLLKAASRCVGVAADS